MGINMTEKIVLVTKRRKVKYVALSPSGCMFIHETKLCNKVPLGHKVYMVINDDGLCEQLFDLTMWFGEGNEPITAKDFNSYVPHNYQDYKEKKQ